MKKLLIENISVVIIAKDAQLTIKKTLDSLKKFKEVILYLNNTTDDTQIIAKQYNNTNIIKGDFIGFGPTKNKASSYASNDWILSIDSDEVLSDMFCNNLQAKTLDNNTIYSILRQNYYKDKKVKYCWGNDNIVRLYNKLNTKFTNDQVHENIIENNKKLIRLQGTVKHYPYNNISDFIKKLDHYSTIYAIDNKNKKKSSPLKALFNAWFSFFKTYFIKKGFLDGYVGLIIAFSHMATNFYKYMKLYEYNKDN